MSAAMSLSIGEGPQTPSCLPNHL